MPSLGRLHLITDTRPGRDPLAVVRGRPRRWPAPSWSCRSGSRTTPPTGEAYDLARRVLALCAPYGATCLVNDRLHVALAVGAAGGHVGADDLPVAAARRVLGPTGVLGATARDAGHGAPRPVAGGRQLPGRRARVTPPAPRPACRTRIGPGRGPRRRRRRRTCRSIAIGGVTAARVPALRAAGAYGVAVVGARLRRRRPGRATAELLEALTC